MRFGLVLRVVDAERPLPGLVAQALAAEAAGFDLAWVDEQPDGALPDALAVACALAPHTITIRVGVGCQAGATHPVHLAEQAAVADLTLGGRLVLGLRPVPGTEERLGEVVDLLAAAGASAPFAHHGEHWQVPAQLPDNHFGVTDQVTVTPAPLQLELPLWLSGPDTAVTEVAASRGLGLVGGDDEDADALTRRWAAIEQQAGPAARRLRRVGRRRAPTVGGALDGDALLARLGEDQRRWHLDTAVLEPPAGAGTDQIADLVDAVAHHIRPRLALAALPPGLVEHWQRILEPTPGRNTHV